MLTRDAAYPTDICTARRFDLNAALTLRIRRNEFFPRVYGI